MSTNTLRIPIVPLALGALAMLLVTGAPAPAVADSHEPLDPARNVPLPCEVVATPGLTPRSARNIAHLANVCGFVGTDVEFQSRMADDGLHDYAFLGTMGGGLRIFDITDPAHPFSAGAYADPGWQGDVQVRGDIAVIAFDPLASGNTVSGSTCLRGKNSTTGVDIVRLHFDPATATFQTALLDCVANLPSGGAHNSTLHPSGEWLAISNPRGATGSVDVVDLRGTPAFRYRIVQNGTPRGTICPSGASFTCISNGRAGTWNPHDLSFSGDGDTMYVAAVGTGTMIVDVAEVLNGQATAIGFVPNVFEPNGLNNPRNIEISHQSDVSADGKILVITDERGGGLNENRCNRDANGVIGGMHFWAVGEVPGIPASSGASPTAPGKIGSWIYPNPMLALDPLDATLSTLPRTERGCTIHVFRLGGNGTSGPGAIQSGFDGVSGLGIRRLVTAHYGAGVWHIDFAGGPTDADGTVEDNDTTWGNTVGWNVMPGADTWSAKEYKGYVYAGDMARGFDVYSFTDCEGLGCLIVPVNNPGRASGGGQVPGELAELAILRGTAPGGKANFGVSAEYVTGAVAPSGQLTFIDHATGKKVQSTSIDSFNVVGTKATFTGRATVNGVPGIKFVVEVEDLGEPGIADTFRIVLADGFAAGGVLLRGNIQVQSGSLLP